MEDIPYTPCTLGEKLPVEVSSTSLQGGHSPRASAVTPGDSPIHLELLEDVFIDL